MSIVLNKSLCGRGHPALRLQYVLYETCDRYVNRVCSIGNIWWWKRSMGASIWICTGAAIDTESLFRVHHTRHTHSPRDRTYVCITAAHRWRNINKYNGLGKVNQTNWLRWTWMTVPMLGIQGTVVREQNDGSWARWRCAHIGWAVTNLHQLSCTNQLAAGAGKGLEDDFDVDWKKKQISWYRTHSKNFCCLVVRRTSRCMCRQHRANEAIVVSCWSLRLPSSHNLIQYALHEAFHVLNTSQRTISHECGTEILLLSSSDFPR